MLGAQIAYYLGIRTRSAYLLNFKKDAGYQHSQRALEGTNLQHTPLVWGLDRTDFCDN